MHIWRPDIILNCSRNIIRATYYTSAIGSEEKIDEIAENIKKGEYFYKSSGVGVGGGRTGGIKYEQYKGFLFPKVFKKLRKSQKSKGVDINIAIDMLNHASSGSIDVMYLLSGDGDFIPLIKAVMQKGVRVHLMALSEGLNNKLPISVDVYECIDDRLFTA